MPLRLHAMRHAASTGSSLWFGRLDASIVLCFTVWLNIIQPKLAFNVTVGIHGDM